MSLLFQVVFAHECTSTHHKLALDALRHLRGEQAHRWRDLFLQHFDAYLDGAKAPDTQFKDFRNHVVHVRERYWGGAAEAVRLWYEKALQELQQRRWREAVFAAGVLSHYYTDPLQPLHTAQTEDEGPVHRAVEWSVFRSYHELQSILVRDFGGYPHFETASGPDWLAVMVRKGAELAHPHYHAIIDHYDLAKGVANPPAGLDQELKDRFAKLIGYAVIGYSRILERLLAESRIEPPSTHATLIGCLAALTVPIAWVTRKLSDVRERAAVRAIYREWQDTGRVQQSLPADDKAVRHLHAIEVLRTPLADLDQRKPRRSGTQHGTGAPARQRDGVVDAATPLVEDMAESPRPQVRRRESASAKLSVQEDIARAPGIGPKTAERLRAIDVHTVGDLLELDCEQAAMDLGVHFINAEVVHRWQAAARLACRLPQMTGTAAQLLVACGFETVELLAAPNAEIVHAAVTSFAKSGEGRRLLHGGELPTREAIQTWIAAASATLTRRAA